MSVFPASSGPVFAFGSLKRAHLALLLALSCAAARTARAQAGIVLEYSSPEGCGSQSEVLDKFWQAWGEGDPVPDFKARVSVARTGGRYLVSYRAELEGKGSERKLEVESCSAATEAAALLLVLTADPLLADALGASELVEEDSGLSGSGRGQTEPAAGAASGAPPKAASETEGEAPVVSGERAGASAGSSRTWRSWIGLSASVASSLGPSWALGPSLDGGVGFGLLAVGVRATLRFAPQTEAATAPGVQLFAVMAGGHIWAGPSLRFADLRLEPYLGGGVEVLSIQPSGAVVGTAGASPFVFASFGCRLLWVPHPRFGVAVTGGAQVPLERPPFILSGVAEPVFQPDSASLDAVLGISWNFGSQ